MPRRDNKASSSASELVKPSLPALSSATTRLTWASPHVAFGGGRFEKAFFDVRVFNPSAPSNQQPQMSATYRKHEKEKRRHYEHRVNEIERSSFTPLVFSTTDGMGPSALTFYRRLADLLGERSQHTYQRNHVMDADTPEFRSAPSVNKATWISRPPHSAMERLARRRSGL